MKQQQQNLFSIAPRITQALILCLLWLLVSGDLHVFAEEKAPAPDSEVSVAIGSGLHFFNVSGYRGCGVHSRNQ